MYLSLQLLKLKWKIKKVRRKQGKGFLTKQTQQVLCPINVRGWRWLVTWGITIRYKFPREDLGKAQRMLCCYIFTLRYPQICTFGIPAEIYTHFDTPKPAERHSSSSVAFLPWSFPSIWHLWSCLTAGPENGKKPNMEQDNDKKPMWRS